MTTKLEQKVGSLEEKVQTYERKENLDEKVQQAIGEIDEYNRELRKLNERLADLTHFTAVLQDVFDQDIPESVIEVRSDIDRITDRRQQDILELVRNEDLAEKRREVRDVQEEIKNATDDVQSELQNIQTDWEQRISTARSVLKIAGSDRSFESTLDRVEILITQNIWKTSEQIESLNSRWKGLKRDWDKESVDWDSFQRDHGLNNKTIDVLQKLSKGESVQIGNVDSKVLSDIGQVDQLGNNIRLTL